ncbi:MAG: adenylate/guanylate cyclase domain-containing protein [Anaerolineales bacterium]
MWVLTLRAPDQRPREIPLQPGYISLGRSSENDIVLDDVSASRRHAALDYDAKTQSLVLYDLQSTNGTFVNQEAITLPHELKHGDTIRIGALMLQVQRQDNHTSPQPPIGTRALTRDTVLQSIDQHAVLLYEISRQLNTVTDLKEALQKTSSLLEQSLDADKCEIFQPEQFDKLHEYGFSKSIAQQVVEQRAAALLPELPQNSHKSALLLRIRTALCVPILSDGDLLGLIYAYKNRPEARPFSEQDLQLAVAISHQAALTMQRMLLLARVRREEQIRAMLERFLSPQEAQYILEDYQTTGKLPEMRQQRCSVLFVDIADSTGLTERLGATAFGEILKHFYKQITEIIFENGGLLDKYLGDGVLALFGLTAPEDAELRAVRAGLQILQAIESWSALANGERVVIGAVVNTGEVIAGYVGTAQRVELTVIGDPINVAARLQPHARPNRLLVGPGTMAAISGHYPTQRLGGITIRGRSREIQVYEVLR